MNKKAVNWGVVISILVAVVISGVVILFVVMNAGLMSDVMSDSVCSFAVFFRHLVLGNPLSKVGQQLTSGISLIPVDIPVPCKTKKTNIGSSENPLNSEEFMKLIGDEAKRCWTLFGSGKWDSLLWSAKGQKFLCFDDDVYVRFEKKCSDSGEICNSDSDCFSGTCKVVDISKTDIRKFLLTQSVDELGGTSRTYSQIIPDEVIDFFHMLYGIPTVVPLCPGENCQNIEGNKVKRVSGITEDCEDSGGEGCLPRRYNILVYYIDYIAPAALQYVNLNSIYIDTVCHTYERDTLGGDKISVCIREIEQ